MAAADRVKTRHTLTRVYFNTELIVTVNRGNNPTPQADLRLCFKTFGLSETLNILLEVFLAALSRRAVPFIYPVSAGVHHYR